MYPQVERVRLPQVSSRISNKNGKVQLEAEESDWRKNIGQGHPSNLVTDHVCKFKGARSILQHLQYPSSRHAGCR